MGQQLHEYVLHGIHRLLLDHLEPLGRKVPAVVDYDNFTVFPDIGDAYFDMVRDGIVTTVRQGPFFIPSNAGQQRFKGVETGAHEHVFAQQIFGGERSKT